MAKGRCALKALTLAPNRLLIYFPGLRRRLSAGLRAARSSPLPHCDSISLLDLGATALRHVIDARQPRRRSEYSICAGGFGTIHATDEPCVVPAA